MQGWLFYYQRFAALLSKSYTLYKKKKLVCQFWSFSSYW